MLAMRAPTLPEIRIGIGIGVIYFGADGIGIGIGIDGWNWNRNWNCWLELILQFCQWLSNNITMYYFYSIIIRHLLRKLNWSIMFSCLVQFSIRLSATLHKWMHTLIQSLELLPLTFIVKTSLKKFILHMWSRELKP